MSTPTTEGAAVRARRDQLSWFEKRLGTGRESTRNLYAWSRRVWNRKELARRRSLVPALAGDSNLVIPADLGYAVIPAGQIPEADEVAQIARQLADDATLDARASKKKPQLVHGLLPRNELTLEGVQIFYVLMGQLDGGHHIGF